jgi:hypothetical protein
MTDPVAEETDDCIKSPTLEEQAVARVTATELALSSLKMSAASYQRASHEAHIPAAYREAIERMTQQLVGDEA